VIVFSALSITRGGKEKVFANGSRNVYLFFASTAIENKAIVWHESYH